MILPLIIGFLFGFLGAIPVAGPVSALVLNHGLKKQSGRGISLAAGAAIAESVYVFLAFTGFNLLVGSIPHFDLISRLMAIGILIGLGTYFIFHRPKKSELNALKPRGKKRGALLFGFSVSIVNPTLIATWSTVVTSIHGYGFFDFTIANSLVFSLSVALGIVSWFSFMLLLIRRNHHRIQEHWLRRIMVTVGLLLVLLGSFSLMKLFF